MTAVRVEIESGGDISVARENKYRYIGAGRYAEQIREARKTIPPENLLFIKYEDFDRDQITYIKSVIGFLGGPKDYNIERTRRVNVWRYDRPLSREEFYSVLALYENEITEVEALTGWDCSDWRNFDGKRT
jgi:hypothetical protein